MCCCSLVRSLSFVLSPRVFFLHTKPSTQVKSIHIRAYTLHTFAPIHRHRTCVSQLLDRFLSIHSFIRFLYFCICVRSVISEDGMLSYICGGLFVLNMFTVSQFSRTRRSVLVHRLSECIIKFPHQFFCSSFRSFCFFFFFNFLLSPRLHFNFFHFVVGHFLLVACRYF